MAGHFEVAESRGIYAYESIKLFSHVRRDGNDSRRSRQRQGGQGSFHLRLQGRRLSRSVCLFVWFAMRLSRHPAHLRLRLRAVVATRIHQQRPQGYPDLSILTSRTCISAVADPTHRIVGSPEFKSSLKATISSTFVKSPGNPRTFVTPFSRPEILEHSPTTSLTSSSLRPTTHTRAPRSTYCKAKFLPIPLDAPKTRTRSDVLGTFLARSPSAQTLLRRVNRMDKAARDAVYR